MKKILIAGASSGIGRALACNLAAQDISVISLSRKAPDLPVHSHITYDVRSGNDLPPFDGPLDGLVYCPGSVILKPFKLLKEKDFRDDLEINFLGAVRIVRHYLPALTMNPGASIVLFSTVAAAVGMPFHTSIAASKGAIEGFMRSLAAELAPGLRVNAIAPSLVKTPLTARLTDSDLKISIASERHPLKQIGNPDNIAATAAFLLSEQASWITGQVLHVDGGMSTLKL